MIVIIVLGIIFYLLYRNGYMPVSSKHALVFIGSMGYGTNRCHATFKACTGRIHRIFKVKETRSYSFVFDGRISKGTVTVQITDKHKVPLLSLDGTCPAGSLFCEKGQRYYLYIRFHEADGDYQLKWD